MNFFSRIERAFRKRFKRSKPSSSAIPKNPVDTRSYSWVYNPEVSDLFESRRFAPENPADTYESPNSLGTFDPNPGSASLDYDNKREKSETTNRMDDSLSAISSESLLQAEIERLQEELEGKIKENNSLHEQLKRRSALEANNLNTSAPALSQPPPPPPPPPPPSPPPALFKIADPLQALKEQIAKSGKNNPIKPKENKGQEELLNELKKKLETRRAVTNPESEN